MKAGCKASTASAPTEGAAASKPSRSPPVMEMWELISWSSSESSLSMAMGMCCGIRGTFLRLALSSLVLHNVPIARWLRDQASASCHSAKLLLIAVTLSGLAWPSILSRKRW